MLNYIPTQENSSNLGVSHHLEVMIYAPLHSHTGELTQPSDNETCSKIKLFSVICNIISVSMLYFISFWNYLNLV